MRMISFNSPVCSISSSAAASGRSSMLRISGRKIPAPPTGQFFTKTPTTAGLPRAGETSSSPVICVFFPGRWVCPAPAMCWSFTGARSAFRSKAGRGCGSHTPWSTSGDGRRRTRQMPSNSVDRLCVWRKCSAAKFRRVRCITASLTAALR